jgi:hypothetical protein
MHCIAQRSSRSGYGVKGGFHLAGWRSAVITYDPVPGVTLGGYAPIWVCPSLEVQPELLLSLQGASITLPDDDRRTTRTAYVQLPVTAKFFLNRTFNLQGGIMAGMLVAALANDENVKDGFNSLDHGLLVGLGIDQRNGFDLTLRYYSGMSALLADDQRIYPTNRLLQITAGKRLGQFSQRRLRRH